MTGILDLTFKHKRKLIPSIIYNQIDPINSILQAIDGSQFLL